MSAEVKIRLSSFLSKGFYCDNGDKGDQVLIGPPIYNKTKVAEGYDKLLMGKLELDDQDLIFWQEAEDSPIILRELKVQVKGFNLIFVDLEMKGHNDGRMKRGLVTALSSRHKQSKG